VKCIKCGWDNLPTSLKCEECRALLPQTEDLSVSDAMGGVFYTEESADALKDKPSGDFAPMREMEDAMGLLLEERITVEEFKEKVHAAVRPLRALMERIGAMEPELRKLAVKGMAIVEEAYGTFEGALAEVFAGLDADDDNRLEKGFKTAREAVEGFRKAITVSCQEIRECEDELAHSRGSE